MQKRPIPSRVGRFCFTISGENRSPNITIISGERFSFNFCLWYNKNIMKIFFLISLVFFLPSLAQGAAGLVNNQPTYAVPPGSGNILIFDATLSEVPSSITVYNNGTAGQADITKIFVFEDGHSSGWDGDEREVVFKSYSPFWESELSGNFSQKRIFVTVNIASAVSNRTLQPKIKTNFSEEEIIGLERKILTGASIPQIPVAPFAQSGEAISATAIRWKFSDLSNNEFGFRILDKQLKRAAVKEIADLSYIDETGLEPSTCYSGRRAVAYNDRGESDHSANFSEVCTLAKPVEPVVEEVRPPALTSEVEATTSEVDVREVEPPEITIRLQIIEILKQLIQLFQEKIKLLQASIFQAFDFFTNWLESRFH